MKKSDGLKEVIDWIEVSMFSVGICQLLSPIDTIRDPIDRTVVGVTSGVPQSCEGWCELEDC